MAQYERFLSYLFTYEQDQKGDNCGFARVEHRQGTIRIQISVHGMAPVAMLLVYGFYRDGQNCVCVPLGRMMVNGGAGQFQYIGNEPFVQGSKVRFDALSGLLLCNPQEEGKACATVWDDEPFGLSMFRNQEEEAAEPEQEKTEDSGEQTGAEPRSSAGGRDRKDAETQKPADSGTRQADGRPGPDQLADSEAQSGEIRTEEKLETEDHVPELSEETILHAEACEGESGNTEGTETVGETEAVKEAKHTEGTEAAGGADEADEAELLWSRLCRRFRRIETLPGDPIVCLQAMPADIGRLPRANWMLGNNGFLMYSYVRYRYVVFARLNRQEYELWVPGVYGRNEELLAELFGFLRFRSMKSSSPAPGDFGYWSVPLRMTAGRTEAACAAEQTKERTESNGGRRSDKRQQDGQQPQRQPGTDEDAGGLRAAEAG